MSPALALTAAISFLLGVLYVIGLMTFHQVRKHGWRNDR